MLSMPDLWGNAPILRATVNSHFSLRTIPVVNAVMMGAGMDRIPCQDLLQKKLGPKPVATA
jgi:hypothetical protein